ncbi:aminotransferase class V-fold PLP-dependent enzyme [Amaricoccus sp.]|uniref:pyridoxal-phosphate-dependent aminotransferase family protein n=1 Tax=Amaricoccus sp. TaxID=1872485 RepID=UPI001B593991|nr:aminotransferase class V-fold PLP-dependent enzyme [Amaricoccus sp.]MBP7000844.1 alanine--glyoxylate aminotransferase family protein [Amaricoccus sp.]
MSLAFGRDLRVMPGPSVIPDRVLRAMHRAAPNIYGGELAEVTEGVLAGLRRVARTSGDVALYIGNGHAAWEAATANLLAPGERALVVVTGRFGQGWADTAARMGIAVETLDEGFRAAADPGRIEDRLRADREGRIKAVLVVHADTASSVRNDIPAVRAAIDAAGHPALLAVDGVASLGCDRLEMDAFGADLLVGACQKGLMTPPGVAAVWIGPRARAAAVDCRSPYWDWGPRIAPARYYQLFCGTAPTHHIYGLAEALAMIEAEGLENVWARHAAFARAVWAAVEAWGAAGALALNIADPARRSHAVTTVRLAGAGALPLQRWCEAEAGLTLGVGLVGPGEREEDLFRIAHMGHVDPPMLLGALATIEAGLAACGLPHGRGAVEAAARVIAAARPVAARPVAAEA